MARIRLQNVVIAAPTDSHYTPLERAVASFLDGASPAAGYDHRTEGSDQMLVDMTTGRSVLLTRPDGAVYLERSILEGNGGAGLTQMLERRGMRRTGTTLTLLIAGDAAHFCLFASPRYRAAAAGGGGDVWK